MATNSPMTALTTITLTDALVNQFNEEDQAAVMCIMGDEIPVSTLIEMTSDHALGIIHDHLGAKAFVVAHTNPEKSKEDTMQNETSTNDEFGFDNFNERHDRYTSRKFKKADLARMLIEAEDKLAELESNKVEQIQERAEAGAKVEQAKDSNLCMRFLARIGYLDNRKEGFDNIIEAHIQRGNILFERVDSLDEQGNDRNNGKRWKIRFTPGFYRQHNGWCKEAYKTIKHRARDRGCAVTQDNNWVVVHFQ